MPAETFTFEEEVAPQTFSFEDVAEPERPTPSGPVRFSDYAVEGLKNVGRQFLGFPAELVRLPETMARAAGQVSVEGLAPVPQVVSYEPSAAPAGVPMIPMSAEALRESVRANRFIGNTPIGGVITETMIPELLQSLSGMTSPEAVGTLPLFGAGAIPAKTALAAFSTQATGQLPEAVARLQQASPEEQAQAAADLIVTGGMAAMPAFSFRATKGAPDAIQRQSETVLRDVPTQPGESAGPVPVERVPEPVRGGGAQSEVRPPGDAAGGVSPEAAGQPKVSLKPVPKDSLVELDPVEIEGMGTIRFFEVASGELKGETGTTYKPGARLNENQLRRAGYEPPATGEAAVKPVEVGGVELPPVDPPIGEVIPAYKTHRQPLPDSMPQGQREVLEKYGVNFGGSMELVKGKPLFSGELVDNGAGINWSPKTTPAELARKINSRRMETTEGPTIGVKEDLSKPLFPEKPLTPAEKAAIQGELEAEVPAAVGPAAAPVEAKPQAVAPAAESTGMEGAVAMGASKPSEHVPARETATNITRARIDAGRQERGQGPLFAAIREKNPVVFDRTMARIDQDPGWLDTLVADLTKKPRTPTPEEVMALDYRYVDLQNEYAKATRDMALAYEDGRLSDLPDIRARIDIWQDKLDAFEKVARASMSEWGRSGQISQQLMREDYTLVPMLARKRAAVGGRPLTDAEILDVKAKSEALADAGTKAEASMAKAQEKVEAAQAQTAERDALKQELKDAKAQPKPKSPSEADALAKKKQSLQKRIKEIEGRIEKREFLARKSRPLDVSMDEEAVRLEAQFEHLKDRFKEELERDRIRASSFLQKAAIEGKEMLSFSRNLKSSTDVSAVLRQGAFVGFGHPLLAARNVPRMFRALAKDEVARALNYSIKLRPNALNGNYAKGELFTAPLESVKLAAQEELLMSRWAHRFLPTKVSNRAYVTYLNLLRADAFDTMVRAWETKGKLADAELKAVGNYINVATGRGNLGKFSSAAEPLAYLFFSPRLATSRFQLLAGQPMWRGTARSRVGIAKEYARFAAGVGAFYALAKFAGYEIGDDPKASDFGKVRVGNTMVDPAAGLSQTFVLEARLTTGEASDLAHHAHSILSDAPYGKPTVADVIGRYLRTKLAPVPSTALAAREGKDLLGRPVTLGTTVRDLYMPLSMEDIYKEMTKGENALPEDLAIAVLILFGMGAQTGDKPLPRP